MNNIIVSAMLLAITGTTVHAAQNVDGEYTYKKGKTSLSLKVTQKEGDIYHFLFNGFIDRGETAGEGE